MRRNCQQLTRHELDLVIMAQVNALQHKKTSENSRNHMTYFFQGERICRTFFFLHGIQKKRFRALCKKVSEDGISTHIHGNTKRVQSNALDFADRERAVNFVKNAAEVHALPLPGRLPNHQDKTLLLPSDMPKIHVYREY